MSQCVFCKIAAGELPASIVYEDDVVIAFLDIAPLNKGHALVVPREHYYALTACPPDVQAAMIQAASRIAAAVMRAVDADGFNLVLSNGACAGQVVQHVHLHVVPRFPDDGIALPSRSVPYDSEEEKEQIVSEIRKRLRSHE